MNTQSREETMNQVRRSTSQWVGMTMSVYTVDNVPVWANSEKDAQRIVRTRK